jgi:hypothetical protein
MLDRLKWIIIGILALLVVASGLFLSLKPGQSTADWEAGQYCRANYRRAHTSSDTLIVDAQVPVLSRPQAGVALSCGAMRRARQLE